MSQKTFADVFDDILMDRRKFLSFLALIGSLTLALLLVGWLASTMLGIKPEAIKELNISASGAHILLESVTNTHREYIVMVPPQGWQKSGIEVKKNEQIRFVAAGAVNIDLWSVMQKATKRHEFEDKITSARNLDRQSVDPNSVPEHYFSTDLTQEDRDKLRLLRPWNGPDGNDETKIKVYENAFAGRTAKKIIPSAPFGALIGAIGEKVNELPKKQDAFLIGKNYGGEEFKAQKEGELWFNVNDVWDEEDTEYPNKFYDDNVGYFWVKVLITPGR
ncbi:MAG TPA: hypothetical protein VN844_20465 [Pyrinomonadaceae bacterium]|nr:hypothetical protein [Pyrinomonadaceae bacterium]